MLTPFKMVAELVSINKGTAVLAQEIVEESVPDNEVQERERAVTGTYLKFSLVL